MSEAGKAGGTGTPGFGTLLSAMLATRFDLCYTGTTVKRQEDYTMPLHIKIASDFVCPYCYVLEAVLEQARKGDSSIVYVNTGH